MAEEKDMNQGEERVTDSSEPVPDESTEAQMPDSKTDDEPSEQTDEASVAAQQEETPTEPLSEPSPEQKPYLYQWDYGAQQRHDQEMIKKQRKKGIRTFAIVMSVAFALTLALLIGVLWLGIGTGPKEMTTAEVAAKVLPQTVLITAQNNTGISYGTGFFIREDGYIATNWHVVAEAPDDITVTLYSGETKKATLRGYSIGDDLAVLKISGQGYSAVTIGDSDAAEVGSKAIAVGNPSGPVYAWSVTEGVVSAKQRTLSSSDSVAAYDSVMMQMDTPVNSGNSGGPLCNAYGEVIGIITRKSTDAENIGFAIPINGAIKILNHIIENGTANGIVSEITRTRPLLGISCRTIKVGEAYDSGFSTVNGTLIVSVESNSVLAGKVQKNDIITSFNGSRVSSLEDLTAILYQCKPGQKVNFEIVRNGTTLQKTVTLRNY